MSYCSMKIIIIQKINSQVFYSVKFTGGGFKVRRENKICLSFPLLS